MLCCGVTGVWSGGNLSYLEGFATASKDNRCGVERGRGGLRLR